MSDLIETRERAAMFEKRKRIQDRNLLDEVKTKTCIVCGRWPTDPAHVRSVGAGGDDTKSGVIPLCREHHRESHDKGWVRCCDKYDSLKNHLDSLGWHVVDYFGLRKLSRK